MQQTRCQMRTLTFLTAAKSQEFTLLELSLLNTLWMNSFTFFGMRPGKERGDLCWGDLQLKTDSEGNSFIEFNIERHTKTRTGENPRNIRQKKPMYEDKSNADRCPVNSYLAYKDHRPTDMMTDESPFYLAVNNENPKPGQMWFKCSPLGEQASQAKNTWCEGQFVYIEDCMGKSPIM